MHEKIENPELKAFLENDYELNVEEMEKFIEVFMKAKLIIPAEIDSNINLNSSNYEEIDLDEDMDVGLIKIEDEEGNEFIPAFTDDEEVEKADFDFYCLVFETENLANLLFESLEEYVEGIAINPFTDNSAEVPLESLFALFDLLEDIDDSDLDDFDFEDS